MSPARRAAFMAALRATGNQRIAAERARVSGQWVRKHRKADPEFRRESDEALRQARDRLRERAGRAPDRIRGDRGSCRPPSGWGSLEGEELVVYGITGQRTQIARAKLRQWTPRAEARFLRALGATCNVQAACAEAGLSVTSAYRHRKRWMRFRALWDEALEEGAMRLEAALAQHGCNLLSGEGLPEPAPLGPMTVEQVIHALHMHQYKLYGLGRKRGCWRPPESLSDAAVSERILRKLEPIAALQEKRLAQADVDRSKRGFARRREAAAEAEREKGGTAIGRPAAAPRMCRPRGGVLKRDGS